MQIKELQKNVDDWINEFGVRYFNELTNTAILTEEVGEVARIIARRYGEQSEKESDANKDLADELYLRIKEEESSFEEIAYEFSEGNEKYKKGRIGPVMINNVEASISTFLKIGYINQLWQPIKINGLWHILRLDKVLHSKFNTNLKLKLALELGDKFLNNKFLEIQTKKQ